MLVTLSDNELVRRLIVIWPWTNNPDVARVNLFMSFPNSGSRYGLTVLEVATFRTAASFYGKEYVDANGIALHRDEAVLAYEELPNGPFLTSNLAVQNGGKLLTRTYCGGHCFSQCTCEEYDISLDAFELECTLSEDADTTREYLDESIISSTIILIRDPLDNIVSRFHYEHRLQSGDGSNSWFQEWDENYEKDHVGFRKWCEYIDSVNAFTEQQCFADDPTLLELMDHVPCHSEFYKYAHWYNNAFELVNRVSSESQNIYYEDFFYRLHEQTEEVVEFLGLNNTGNEFDFRIRDYTYYYTLEEKTKIINLLLHIASDETKEHLRRYLIVPQE